MLTDAAPIRRQGPDRRGDKLCLLAADLRLAMERAEIGLLYQPQFDCRDNRLTGAEALSRWHHPARGEIGGAELFALAETCGEGERLFRHIAGRALEAAALWPADLRLSINVRAEEIVREDFAAGIAAMLSRSGFAASRLTLEITEETILSDLVRSAEQLQPLADIGIRLALDDFGAGFCHFGYLKRLPLQELKLDQSMVLGIEDNPSDLAILRGIVAMATALDLSVVAEGIERAAQLEAVVREGCAGWQGFLGAEPMSAAQFARLLEG